MKARCDFNLSFSAGVPFSDQKISTPWLFKIGKTIPEEVKQADQAG
jgi:hypothetical protein